MLPVSQNPFNSNDSTVIIRLPPVQVIAYKTYRDVY